MSTPAISEQSTKRHKRLKLGFIALNLSSWYGCVLLASYQQPILEWLGLGLAAINLLYSYRLMPADLKTRFDRHFIAALGLGLGFDQIALSSGLIRVNSELGELKLVPLWLVSLWLIFLASRPLYRQVFDQNPVLAALCGAILGPASYYLGEKFNLLFFSSLGSWLCYGLFWGTYFIWMTSTPTAMKCVDFDSK